MNRAVIYLRVSKEEQEVLNQELQLQEWCQSQGFEVVKVYSEHESGWQGKQGQLELLKKDIRTGKLKVDYLVVWSIDRLTRRGVGDIFGTIDMLRAYGVSVRSMQEQFINVDTSGLQELLIALVAWIARFESDLKSKRILAGIARRRSQGLPVGRQRGARDKKPRRRRGYLLRYADQTN